LKAQEIKSHMFLTKSKEVRTENRGLVFYTLHTVGFINADFLHEEKDYNILSISFEFYEEYIFGL